MVVKKISKCRVCENTNLALVLDLGEQALTGVFPRSKSEDVLKGPLQLVKCMESGAQACGLLQLRHSYPLVLMYGDNYGYRSSLNPSMVSHLQNQVKYILGLVALKPDDVIVDIGSNDSTLLQAYPKDLTLIGIDPCAKKFAEFYPSHIHRIEDFFTAKVFQQKFPKKRARIITAFSMFYDLEDPVGTLKELVEILDEDGLVVLEQSYMPTMLDTLSYDTVCHEHLEYYSLKQMVWIAERAGLKIVDVFFNDVNGGSFTIYLTRPNGDIKGRPDHVAKILEDEKKRDFDTLVPYMDFAKRVETHRKELLLTLNAMKKEGKVIVGYGASTKGNVLLQYCGITDQILSGIAEINSDKFGTFTPGTKIPIVSASDAANLKPDYYFVLPWHFRNNIVKKETSFLASGGKLFFPLPKIEMVGDKA